MGVQDGDDIRFAGVGEECPGGCPGGDDLICCWMGHKEFSEIVYIFGPYFFLLLKNISAFAFLKLNVRRSYLAMELGLF